VLPFEAAQQARVLNVVGGLARAYAIVTVLGTERITEAGRQVAAFVFGTSGQILGYQTKNQLAPAEDQFYVPGRAHQIYEANGV
jgi:predicted aspartyl protease